MAARAPASHGVAVAISLAAACTRPTAHDRFTAVAAPATRARPPTPAQPQPSRPRALMPKVLLKPRPMAGAPLTRSLEMASHI